MKKLKNIRLVYLIIIFSTMNLVAQKNMTKKKLTPEKIYTVSTKYNLQDSFLINKHTLKKNSTLLAYMDEKNLEEYLKKCLIAFTRIKETKQYIAEIKNIKTLDEWLVLLNKYPSIGNQIKGINKEERESFKEVLAGLKSGKYFLAYNGIAGIDVVDNTQDNVKEYQNMKKLKSTQ